MRGRVQHFAFARVIIPDENVRVELGKNLTFIVGQNGSGKSAVLAAIHVALTGRARGSERAGSLAELVRGGGEEGASEGVSLAPASVSSLEFHGR